MNTAWKIALVLGIIVVILLILYAAPPTRGFMEETLGPPLSGISGGVVETVTSSFIWRDWLVPFPNQMLILGAILWIPLFYIWLRTRTKVRQIVQIGAAKDSGFSMPVSQTTISQTPPGATVRPETVAKEPEPKPATPTVKEEAAE